MQYSLLLLGVFARSKRLIVVLLGLVLLIAVVALVFAPDDNVAVTSTTLLAKPVEAAAATPAATPEPPGAAQTVAAALGGAQTATAQALLPTATPIPVATPTLIPDPTITVAPIATPTQTPISAPTMNPYSSFIPIKIKIPAIGVDTFVEGVGQTKTGAMDVPKDVWNVAWYNLGPHPGEHGSSVIAGHLDSTTGPAIFWHLNDLQDGAKIYVTDATKRQLEFAVVKKTIFDAYDKTAIEKIFDFKSEPMLNLITCNGTYDRKAQNYSNRLVVYAKFVGLVKQ